MSDAGGFSLTHGAHVGIGSLPIVLFGNAEQKKKYLPKLASGELIAAYALTEPGSGSDALGAKTIAKLNDAGTHYVLNENLLGEVGRGHVIAFNILNIGRYKLGVGTVGGSKRALELAIQYTNQRQQFKTKLSSFNLTKEKLATMAATLYASESLNYRTVGYYDEVMSQLSEEQQKDPKAIAQAVAEYAIECSIAKVFGSETLDYIADEAVQLRIYRDSRINRIFEGTNEINRLIVPGTFMKKALKGELPLLKVAQDLQEELLMLMPEEISDEPLAQEKYLVKNAKKIGILAAGIAAQRFGTKLEQEQEVLVNIANIANQIYAMESVVIRTAKAIERDGAEKAKQKILYAQIFCQEAFGEIEKEAKETILASADGDNGRIMLSALRKLTRYNPYNLILKKREASEKLIEAEKYVV
ncbi:acyl-CoA dehydrogenase/oxidase C-terminal [Rhizophagus irregularis]|uniref:Acyl-CoA dehydrogenase/oxidase C-terminal n=1 Tax=Rhizophagus irregularis TaxID=588596 RepID=A0A2N0QQG1_9GLOM|nr:acyl-CoA dehydrogenase/oxidase C-terminal [Rhizophagus irregularis]